jgi:hypothetical protein
MDALRMPHQRHVVDRGNLNTRGDSVSAHPEVTGISWTDQLTLRAASCITGGQGRWMRDSPPVDDGP